MSVVQFFKFLLITIILFVASANIIAENDLFEPLYMDEELMDLWASLEDIHNPTIEDYRSVEHYLKYGKRPYLDFLLDHLYNTGLLIKPIDRSWTIWNRLMQRICLIGPNDEAPFSQTFVLGVAPDDLSQCIVLYASFNEDTFDGKTGYIQRMLALAEELKQVGFKGHVLVRGGGYPTLQHGGIQFAHIPYSFKILAMLEAHLQGYGRVLWLDCSVHPVRNIQLAFATIETTGYLFLENGSTLFTDYHYSQKLPYAVVKNFIFPDAAVAASDLSIQDLRSIPHPWAGIIGINFQNDKAKAMAMEWFRLTKMVIPAMTLFPEELLVAIAAWRTR